MLYDCAGLRVEKNSGVSVWQALSSTLTLIGSHPSCDIWLPLEGEPHIHAIVYKIGARLLLINRMPKNVFLNGKESIEDTWLAQHDVIDVGDFKLYVCFPHNAKAVTEPLYTHTRSGAKIPYELHIHGYEHPQTHVISTYGISVGSAPHNHVQIIHDDTVSRSHALFVQEENRITVRDLGSTNGTYVDGKRTKEAEITSESTVVLGRTHVSIRAHTAEPLPHASSQLLGNSAHIKHVHALIDSFAPHNAPVLIHGESGTGKEVVARMLHETSPRAEGPWVVLNCGALAHSLIESELFGHEKGSFTGAVQKKAGAFEAADGGTLFLDEIGEMPLQLQPQLLRILETGEVRRIGSMKTIQTHVRIIAATHRNLAEQVQAGSFREDLFHRLHILNISILPLRERKEDIALLAEHFIQHFAYPYARLQLHPETLKKLQEHSWPGNIRELRNVLQRAALLRTHAVLLPEDIQFYTSTKTPSKTNLQPALGSTLHELEKRAIIQELTQRKGNKTEAAAALGISRSTMHRKIEEHGIVVPVF